MFKKSRKDLQLDAFSNTSNHLNSTVAKEYLDPKSWHNQFREQIVMRIDESVFSVLFHDTTGAPNSSIRVLMSMMIAKEAFGWSDSELFSNCKFNLVLRCALGLFNISDPVPAESTYYLFRKRVYEYQKQTGRDLTEEVFRQITSEQIKDFQVNGRAIRMDSKLISSNIAFYSRYEIVHHTLLAFLNTLNLDLIPALSPEDQQRLKELREEKSSLTVYRSTKEEIYKKLQVVGMEIYRLLGLFSDNQTESFLLLKRVFNEQFKVTQEQKVELRPKEEITSSSVQSPHDPDSAYRNKGDQKVKGYSVNITETCSDDGLNLITNAQVDKANVADSTFVQSAIQATQELTNTRPEKVYADGAYQSPLNADFCEGIDMVYSGIQGSNPRFDLNLTPEGLIVIDKQTKQQYLAKKVKSQNKTNEERYSVKINGEYFYFAQTAIRSAIIRAQILNRPTEERRKRNNVEATIYQLGIPLVNRKSKYRGLFKQEMWVSCRCLWINLVRIMNFRAKNPGFLLNFLFILNLNRLLYALGLEVSFWKYILHPKYSFE